MNDTDELLRLAIRHLRSGSPDLALKTLEEIELEPCVADPAQIDMWDLLAANDNQEAAGVPAVG